MYLYLKRVRIYLFFFSYYENGCKLRCLWEFIFAIYYPNFIYNNTGNKKNEYLWEFNEIFICEDILIYIYKVINHIMRSANLVTNSISLSLVLTILVRTIVKFIIEN